MTQRSGPHSNEKLASWGLPICRARLRLAEGSGTQRLLLDVAPALGAARAVWLHRRLQR